MKKYPIIIFSIFSIVILLSLASWTHAQNPPAKVRKPVKNPPQYPNIIDTEGQAVPQPQGAAPQNPPPGQAVVPPSGSGALQVSDPLVKAVEALAGEVRTLVNEMRALNVRQAVQLEIAKMTRLDLRIDHLEREIKPIRDRLALLDAEETNLLQLVTRDSLYAQTATAATLDREATMRQLKANHEYRLTLVRAEKERLKVLDADLAKTLAAVRAASSESEQRAQESEARLKSN